MGQLNDLIWCSNPDYDTLDNLLAHLREHAATILGEAGLEVRFDLPEKAPALPVTGYFRRQVLLLFKEALTNITRHAHASTIRISARLESPEPPAETHLFLELADNGCGFDPALPARPRGHGLANLRSRARALQGTLEIRSAAGQGTSLHVKLPLAPHLQGNQKAKE